MADLFQWSSKNLFCMKSLNSNWNERRIHCLCTAQSQVCRVLLEINVEMEVSGRGSEFIQEFYTSSQVNETPLPFVLWIPAKAAFQNGTKRQRSISLAQNTHQSSRKLDSTLTFYSATGDTMPWERIICIEKVVPKLLSCSLRCGESPMLLKYRLFKPI